ncbi:hypothetical protein [Nocardioides humi]|uniref:Neocarzinostatin family protein n=1 Tax=Nocardioides humi TaxID=449461 RepID=A0ABN2ATK2_9ACTN|nr:hypothetical protein [Nocardioides humi]
MLNTIRRGSGLLAGLLVAGTLAVATPAQAAVTPLPGSNGLGGTITLSDDHFHPGDRIDISGTGFTVAAGTESAPGRPVLGVKVQDDTYEDEGFPWEAGGASYVASPGGAVDGQGGYAAFQIEEDGTFDGWVEIPDDWDVLGQSRLTFLGGSLTTAPDGLGKKLPAQVTRIDFPILGPDQPWVEITSKNHTPGSFIADGKSLSVKVRNFKKTGGGGQQVAFKIDGQDIVVDGEVVLPCIATDADGDGQGTIPLPTAANSLDGAADHTLNALAGTACGTASPGDPGFEAPGRMVPKTFKVTTAKVTSTTHYPGGQISVQLHNYLSASGFGGQKVAVLRVGAPSDVQLGCVTTNSAGNGTGTFTLPANTVVGEVSVQFLAGTACGAGADAPGRSLRLPLTVTAAPAPPPAPQAIANTAKPTVKGKFKVGKALKAKPGAWSVGGVAVSYQWLRNGKPIKGATKAKYKVTKKDRKKKVSVQVTATAPGYAAAVTTSKAKKVK